VHYTDPKESTVTDCSLISFTVHVKELTHWNIVVCYFHFTFIPVIIIVYYAALSLQETLGLVFLKLF